MYTELSTVIPGQFFAEVDYFFRTKLTTYDGLSMDGFGEKYYVSGDSQATNFVINFFENWSALTLIFDGTSRITLSPTPTENIECHLWLDIGNGYEYQPNQDNFTPSDTVLDNLTTPGQYLVYAYNPTTHENGYIEFEVT